MTKKMTLLALVVACTAMFALPSVASAGTWKLEKAVNQNFTISGGVGVLKSERPAGNPAEPLTVECTSTTGTGKYTTETTGSISLVFKGCKGSLGGLKVNCTTHSEAAGTIVASGHIENVHLAKNRTTPGVTITGPGGSTGATLSTFTCFGLTTVVHGSINGHLESGCDTTARTTANLEFASNPATEGEPKWRYVTEDTTKAPDELDVTTAGVTRRGAIDATGSVHFPAAVNVNCTD